MTDLKPTETLDRHYLEWSQFTSARTALEIELIACLDEAINIVAVWASLNFPDNNTEALLIRSTAALARARGEVEP